MPGKKKPYVMDGVTYPSVTEILDGSVPKPALVRWAVGIERAAAVSLLREMVESGMPDADEFGARLDLLDASEKAKNEASSIGKVVHAAIELDLRGKPFPEFTREGEFNAFKSYLNWKEQNQVEDIECEVELYHHGAGYAGRCDFMATVNGKRGVWDNKTSSAIYREVPMQLSAYWSAGLENGYELEEGGILWVPKSEGNDFKALTFNATELAEYFTMFLRARDHYQSLKFLEKRVRRAS